MVFLEHTDTLILSFIFSPFIFFSMHTFATNLIVLKGSRRKVVLEPEAQGVPKARSLVK